MRSKLLQFRITWALYDKIKIQSEKIGFKNVGAYLSALAMLDLSHDQRWNWLRSIANSNKRKLQDMVIEQFIILGITPEEVTFLAQALEARRKGKKTVTRQE